MCHPKRKQFCPQSRMHPLITFIASFYEQATIYSIRYKLETDLKTMSLNLKTISLNLLKIWRTLTVYEEFEKVYINSSLNDVMDKVKQLEHDGLFILNSRRVYISQSPYNKDEFAEFTIRFWRGSTKTLYSKGQIARQSSGEILLQGYVRLDLKGFRKVGYLIGGLLMFFWAVFFVFIGELIQVVQTGVTQMEITPPTELADLVLFALVSFVIITTFLLLIFIYWCSFWRRQCMKDRATFTMLLTETAKNEDKPQLST